MVTKPHVENGFNDAGVQIAPVSLFWESEHVCELVAMVNSTGLFVAQMMQYDKS